MFLLSIIATDRSWNSTKKDSSVRTHHEFEYLTYTQIMYADDISHLEEMRASSLIFFHLNG